MYRFWRLALLCLTLLFAVTHAFATGKNGAECRIYVLKDCPIAGQYAPELNRIVDDYSPKGVHFLLIVEGVDLAKDAKEYGREYGYRIPVKADSGCSMAKRDRVSVSPSVVVSQGGVIKYSGRIDNTYSAVNTRRPAATSHDLRAALDAILAGKPVKTSATQAVGCRLY